MEHLREVATHLIDNEQQIEGLRGQITSITPNTRSSRVITYGPELGQQVLVEMNLFIKSHRQQQLWDSSGFQSFDQVTEVYQNDTLNPEPNRHFQGIMLNINNK